VTDGANCACKNNTDGRPRKAPACVNNNHRVVKLLIYHCLQFKLSCNRDVGNTNQMLLPYLATTGSRDEQMCPAFNTAFRQTYAQAYKTNSVAFSPQANYTD
jgi:hypothetical protein